MRIGILNLPIDNNFGGNLQRYALIKTLQGLGHSPELIQIRFAPYKLPFMIKVAAYIKRGMVKLFVNHNQRINKEKYAYEQYIEKLNYISPFFEAYIPHTDPCYCIDDLLKKMNYDLYIIGSDQVWRKKIADKYFGVMMGSIIPDGVKRIAYAVSFGTDNNELTEEEISYYAGLYKKFSAVSVREMSGLELLKNYGWLDPEAIHLLDPTFLLDKEDYQRVAVSVEKSGRENSLFCYILDESEEKKQIIEDYSEKLGLLPYIMSLKRKVTIESWLNSFNDAAFVITDSFHGLVFSIIYNKPFRLIRNHYRGNARFDSVLETFGLSDDGSNVDWNSVNEIIKVQKRKSLDFLLEQLN